MRMHKAAIACSMALHGLSGVCVATDSVRDALERSVVVEAHVEQLASEDLGMRNTVQQIDHVYCGSSALRGTTFLVTSSLTGEDANGGSVYPPLQIGETAIWVLKPNTAGDLFRRSYPIYGLFSPSRKNLDPRHDQVRMFAEAVEQVWQASNDEQRVGLLRGFAHSEVPEVSVGAIILLAEAAPDELKNLAEQLSQANVSAQSQAAFDEAMFKIDGEAWASSPQHKRLLDRWAKGAANEQDAKTILMRLDLAIQGKQIEPPQLFDILKRYINSDDYTQDVRCRAAFILRWIVNDKAVHDDVFNLLADILEGSAGDRLPVTAAQSLQGVDALKLDQIARLAILRDAYQARTTGITDEHNPEKRITTILDDTILKLVRPKDKKSTAQP